MPHAFVAESVWRKSLGPFYDIEQTKALLGMSSLQAVSHFVERGLILALDASGGCKLYPAFQFGPDGEGAGGHWR
jgi:hypothetical protein